MSAFRAIRRRFTLPYAWLHRVLDLVYPRACAYCDLPLADDRAAALCDACSGALTRDRPLRCPRCAAPVAQLPTENRPCPTCLKRKLHFARTYALGIYQNELRTAVLRLKSGHEPLVRAVVALVHERFGPELAAFRPDMLVSVPMHWRRRLRRGTNSPEEIARHLGRWMRVSVPGGLLKRCRNTLPQAELSPLERFRNLRSAFRLSRRYAIEDARIVLVDDIMTTGATASEAAKTLLDAGAAEVRVVVLARTEDIT